MGYEIRYEVLSAKVSDIIKNRNSVIFVAVDDENTPAGWIQLEVSNFIFSEKTCNILCLFVDKKYRGRRIGKKLLEKAEVWAKENNCKGLAIYSDITRIDSHDFYKHLDFKHVKTQQNFHKSIK
jgi:GNAT superfamily N-acetyltransferase